MAAARIVDTLRRIQGAYLEMPDLRLTRDQAQRLSDLDGPACDALFEVLVDLKILARTSDGAFIRKRPDS